ncbi:hypothetical protein GCM10023194_18830 [Planotetraspora phitsanulokensis]|uniref:Lipoprotein n=1 Tax=Planotetraspora phitsanulokensis TaxID=575192 RepID=A0A8J3XFU8_9ACTN|nr:hypothetical protein [Planotetraspora phitsanulokensis]GII39485.1 hypothetical protein Pph01_44880 [Planotetraspora phitsanulokensis]
MKLRIATLVACSLLCLTACKGGAGKAEPASSAPDATRINAAKSAGSILETGFGQQAEGMHAIAIVQNTSDTVGQKVTVQFNIKDAAGNVLARESEVEHFAHVGEKMPVGVNVYLPEHKKAASVDATLSVEDGTVPSEPFPEVTVDSVELVKLYRGWHTSIWVTNPKPEPLKQPRVEVVCYNKAKKIIGGGNSSPMYLPPSGDTIVEADLFTSGKPSSCTAYVGVSTYSQPA